MDKNLLKEVGLSEGEIQVYLMLLKTGPSFVAKISQLTGLHRTNIYDTLEKLKEKGIVSYFSKEGKRYFKAAHPSKLLDFMKEKQENIQRILPELIDLTKLPKEETEVEVFKGKQALKQYLKDTLDEGKDFFGIGIKEKFLFDNIPYYFRHYIKEMERIGFHEKLLVEEGSKHFTGSPNSEYRFIPKEFFPPTIAGIYANKVSIVILDPIPILIIIKNKQVADSYKKYFDLLWNQESFTYRGIESVKSVFDDMINVLEEGDELLTFGVSKAANILYDYFDDYSKKIIKKKLDAKIIFDEDAKELIKMCVKYNWKVRTLPKQHVTPAEVDVYKNKVAIIVWAAKPYAVVIENKEVAQSFKKFFEIQWKIAKKV